MKSQIKQKHKFVTLLIPAFNLLAINCYLLLEGENHEQSSENN